MPQLRDIATGQVIRVADGAVQEVLASGRYELVAGQDAQVITPAGRLVQVPYEELPRFSQTLPTAAPDPSFLEERNLAHTQQLRLEREYGGAGGTARAVIEGAASGLSLGLYDVIAEGLGLDTEKYAAANPDARLAGELTGILGGAVFGGGTGLLGAAARATPAGFITAKSMQLGAKLGGGVRGMAAAQAAEGAAYGLAQTASQLLITDEPLTAEVVVGELAKNTLFGAGVGAASGAVVGGLTRAAQSAARAADDEAVSAAFDLMSEQGRRFTGTVGKAVADIDFVADDLIAKHKRSVGEAAVSPTEIAEFGRRGKILRSFGDDLEFAAVEKLKAADVAGPDVRLQSLRDQHAAMNELAADVLADLEARGLKIQHRALKNRQRSLLEAMTRADVEPTPSNFRAVDKALGAYRLKLQNVAEQAVGVDVAGRLAQIDQLRAAARVPSRGIRLEQLADETGLVPVARMLDELGMSSDDVMRLASEGQIELRPESGVGLLDPALASRLPKAPDGSPLSTARILKSGPVDDVSRLRAKVQAYQKAATDFDEVGGLSEEALRRIANRPEALGPAISYVRAVRDLVDELQYPVRGHVQTTLDGLEDALAGLTKRAPDEIALARQASREALERAKEDLHYLLYIEEGQTIRPKHIRAILRMADPGKQAAALKALNDYYVAVKKFATEVGSEVHLAQLDDATKAIVASVRESVGNVELGALNKSEIAAAVGFEALDQLGLETPVDEIAQAAVLFRLARGKVVGKAGHSRGVRLTRAVVSRGMSRALPEIGRRSGLVPRGGVFGAGGGGALGASGYWLGAKLVDALSGAREAGGMTAGVLGRFRRAFARAAGPGKFVASRGPLVAMSLLRSARFGPDHDKPDPVDLQQAFKDRAAEIAAVAANPLAAQQEIHDQLAPLRQVSAGLADKVEVLSIQIPLYLYSKMPRDPGTMMMFGKSLWKPSELDILRWAEFYKGALAPVDVLEEAIRPGGTISPQAADAVRTLYPELFGRFTQELMQRQDVLERLDYQQRVRLSILTDAPLDPTMNPKFVSFVQTHIAEREALAAQDAPTPGSGGGSAAPEKPTRAQELL